MLDSLNAFGNHEMFWVPVGNRNANAYVQCVQVLPDRPRALLTCTALVAYAIYVVISFVLHLYRLWLIEICHTLTVFPVIGQGMGERDERKALAVDVLRYKFKGMECVRI